MLPSFDMTHDAVVRIFELVAFTAVGVYLIAFWMHPAGWLPALRGSVLVS